MGVRQRGDKWLVTAESGRDEFGMRRRVCRTVDTEEEAKRLDAKLQSDVYEGRHVKPSGESVPDFCRRYVDGRDKLAPATRSRYEGYLKHVRKDLTSVTLARFTPKIAASRKKQLDSGELLGLRVTDVDLTRSRIHVRQALRKERGKSVIGPCKTRRSRRTVVLPESIAALLAEYAAKRPRTQTPFLSLAGKPYTLDGFESSWSRVRARAAVILVRDAEELHDPFAEHADDELAVALFHDLRHTHATELLRAGVHIKIVAERLGDSEATVMKTYSHVLPDMQETAAAAIEPMLRGLLPRTSA